MKGLLRKEFLLTARRNWKWLGFLLVALIPAFRHGRGVLVAGSYLFMMVLLLQDNSFELDEKARWFRMEKVLPVGGFRVVLARYVAAAAYTLAGAVLFLLASLPEIFLGTADLPYLLSLTGIFLAGGVLVACLRFPLLYRFGVVKSRIVLLAAGAVLILCIAGVRWWGWEVSRWMGFLWGEPWALCLWLLLPVLVMVGSWWLTVKIYEKQEC